MKRLGFAAALAATVTSWSGAQAALVAVATTVTANGTYSPATNGTLSFLNDGVFPPNGTYYQTNTVHDYAAATTFTFTFAGATLISAFKVNVDNNDDYTITLSNGVTTLSRTITAADGVVQVVPGGVETFTSDASLGGTYLASLTFAPFLATSATITSSNGDALYGIGEGQFYTSVVPEPASWALMLGGFGVLGGTVRRRRGRTQRLAREGFPAAA